MMHTFTITPQDWKDARHNSPTDIDGCLVATAMNRDMAEGWEVTVAMNSGTIYSRDGRCCARVRLPADVTRLVRAWMFRGRGWFYLWRIPSEVTVFRLDVPEGCIKRERLCLPVSGPQAAHAE